MPRLLLEEIQIKETQHFWNILITKMFSAKCKTRDNTDLFNCRKQYARSYLEFWQHL